MATYIIQAIKDESITKFEAANFRLRTKQGELLDMDNKYVHLKRYTIVKEIEQLYVYAYVNIEKCFMILWWIMTRKLMRT